MYEFEEVTEINENMENVEYFVNLQDFASSFTTKELLRRCFAKTKVIRSTAFFEYAKQLLPEQFHQFHKSEKSVNFGSSH